MRSGTRIAIRGGAFAFATLALFMSLLFVPKWALLLLFGVGGATLALYGSKYLRERRNLRQFQREIVPVTNYLTGPQIPYRSASQETSPRQHTDAINELDKVAAQIDAAVVRGRLAR